MKTKLKLKVLSLTVISGLALGLFITLAVGSTFLTSIAPFLSSLSHEIEKVNDYYQHKTTLQFKNGFIIVSSGKQDMHGRWRGRVYKDFYSVESGEQLYESWTPYRNGQVHGRAFVWTYENGESKYEQWADFKDGHLNSSVSRPVVISKKAAPVNQSAYGYFRDQFFLDEILLLSMDYDSIYLNDFFTSLEEKLYAESFVWDDFDVQYEAALDELSETPYDSIIGDNEALTLTKGLDLVKHHPFRLAVIDQYLAQGESSMGVLESRYPRYMEDLKEGDVTREDLSAFCLQFDSCMSSYGSPDLEDLFLIDTIDARIYRALFTISGTGEDEDVALFKAALPLALRTFDDLHALRKLVHSGMELSRLAMEPSDVADVVLYTIFMTYMEGDLIKKSVREAWIRKSGTIVAPRVGTGDLKVLSAGAMAVKGHLFFDGGETPSEMGVAWGLSHDPTIAGNKQVSEVASDSFEVHIDGLNEGKAYYARAYASNSMGTSYGSSVSFVAGETSGIVSGEPAAYGLQVYPNPATGHATLSFILKQAAEIELELFSIHGQKVLHQHAGLLPAGAHKLAVDLGVLEPGSYISCLLCDGALMAEKKIFITR